MINGLVAVVNMVVDVDVIVEWSVVKQNSKNWQFVGNSDQVGGNNC